MNVRLANTEEEFLRCFPVMQELRPHLDRKQFVAQVKRQADGDGYTLVFIEDGGDVVAVAGFRLVELLAWGRTMYVDDLVTRLVHRSKGYGSRLLDWLIERARSLGCEQLHLDSGVQRHDAHRFYLHKGMDITSHHFALRLSDEQRTGKAR